MGTGNDVQPAVDVRDKSIIQIGIVVNDAVKLPNDIQKSLVLDPGIS